MFVAKPGWYHTIIGPIPSSNDHQNTTTDEAMQDMILNNQSNSKDTNTEEAMQSCTHVPDAYNSHTTCNESDSNHQSNFAVNDNTYSQITIPSVATNSSYVNGRVESHVTNISPDGKRVSISIQISFP